MCQKVPVECLKCLSLFKAALGYFYGMSRVLAESLGLSEVVLGVWDRVGDAEVLFSLQFPLILGSHKSDP